MTCSRELFPQMALAIEYEWRYGGAQRLTSILARKLKKKLYLIDNTKSKKPSLCWNIRPTRKIPNEKIIFSVVVNKYKPISIPGKFHIKFLHSGSTIEHLKKFEIIRSFYWITHRKRVYNYGKELGLKVYLIPNGYILYDAVLPYISPENKENVCISISRIESYEKFKFLIRLAKLINLPIYIVGSISNRDCLEHMQNLPNRILIFNEIDEKRKNKLLEKCKILIHYSEGYLRDYLEYSILDGMLYGCIPICISKDPHQFDIIERKGLGKNISNLSEVKEAVKEILTDYFYYYNNIRKFMKNFIKEQPSMFKRWLKTLRIVITDIIKDKNIS